jgi:uncharacterized membrane protein
MNTASAASPVIPVSAPIGVPVIPVSAPIRIVVGAVVGAVIGAVIKAVIGAVIGTVIGTVIGVVVAAGQHQRHNKNGQKKQQSVFHFSHLFFKNELVAGIIHIVMS